MSNHRAGTCRGLPPPIHLRAMMPHPGSANSQRSCAPRSICQMDGSDSVDSRVSYTVGIIHLKKVWLVCRRTSTPTAKARAQISVWTVTPWLLITCQLSWR